MGEKIRGAKVRKNLVGQEKNSLVCEEGKKVEKETSDTKAATHHQQTDAQPASEQWLLRKNCPQVLLLSVMSDSMDYPFGWFGSPVLAVSPSWVLLTSCLLIGGGE